MLKKRSRWGAALLSILTTSGLAQLYNVQPRKAALFFAANVAVLAAFELTGVATSFCGYAAITLVGILILIVSFIDAIKNSGSEVQLKWFNRWYIYMIYFVAILVLLVGVRMNVEAFNMPASSMNPTILSGEKFIVDKHVKARQGLYRGDIIVFLYPVSRDKKFIKRLIGLPGDRIRTEGTDLYLNGEKIPHTVVKSENDLFITSEVLGEHHYTVQYYPYHNYPDQDYVVPDGQLFVMGDNRDNSADSREWGFVPMSDVLGKPTFIYWSSDHGRIGKPLQ